MCVGGETALTFENALDERVELMQENVINCKAVFHGQLTSNNVNRFQTKLNCGELNGSSAVGQLTNCKVFLALVPYHRSGAS